jgi:hypothetical protein
LYNGTLPNDRAAAHFRAFDKIQLITLGIGGKTALWHALATIAPRDPLSATLITPRWSVEVAISGET